MNRIDHEHVTNLLAAARPSDSHPLVQADGEAARRIRRDVVPQPRTITRRVRGAAVPRRATLVAAACCAMAAAVAIGVPNLGGGQLTPGVARAAALEALRSDLQTRYSLSRTTTIREAADDVVRHEHRSVMHVDGGSMEITAETTAADDLPEHTRWPREHTIEIGARTYELTPAELSDDVRTRYYVDVDREASNTTPDDVASEAEQEFALDGSRLADVLESLGGEARVLDHGGIEFRLAGRARTFAPALVTVGSSRLGLNGFFDPIGDEAVLALDHDPDARLDAVVRLDQDRRIESVRILTSLRGNVPGAGIPSPSSGRGTGPRSERIVTVRVDYEDVEQPTAPDPSEVTFVKRDGAWLEHTTVIGRWSDLTTEQYEDMLASARRRTQAPATAVEVPDDPAAPVPSLQADVLVDNEFAGRSSRDLESDDRCGAVNPRTGRFLSRPLTEAQLASAVWECSIGPDRYSLRASGDPDAKLPVVAFGNVD